MKKTGLLIKYELMQLLAPLRKENIKKNLAKNIAIGITLLLSFGILIASFVFLEVEMLNAMAMVKMEEVLMAGLILLTMVFIAFFGFFRSISLFLAKDKESLAALPISSQSIFTAKTLSNVIAYSAIAFLLFLPLGITYGVCTGQGAVFYVLAVVLSLLMPVIPMVITTFIAGLLSSAISRVKNKERWLMVISFAFMIGVMVFPMVFAGQSANEEIDVIAMMQFFTQKEVLIKGLVGWFPPALWATRWLNGNWIEGFKFILVSGASFVLLIAVFGKGYQKKILSIGETASSKKTKLREGIYKQKSPTRAVFANEWRQLMRSSVYALNGLSGVIVFPLMIGVFLFTSQTASIGGTNLDLPGILSSVPGVIFMWVSALIFVFCGMVNTAGATAVSREGKYHDHYRLFPVNPSQIVMGKQWFGFSIAAIACIISAVILLIAFKQAALYILAGLVIGLVMNYTLNAIGLMIDILKPKFDWKNETQAIKQNMNAMIQMVVYLLVLVGFGFLTYGLYKTGMNLGLLSLVLCLPIIAGFGVVQGLLCNKFAKIYIKKETN